MLEAYKEWYKIFGIELRGFRAGRVRGGRRKAFVSYEEREWCGQKFLDPHMLREVELLVREIWERLINMGIIS